MSEHGPAGPTATTELAAELRRLRLDHGLSYRLLARRLGLSAHSGLADYETGRRIPPIDLVTTYETLFELQPGSLERLRASAFAERARRKATVAQPPDDQVAVVSTPAEPRSVGRYWPALAALSVVAAVLLVLAALDAPPPGHSPSNDASPPASGHSAVAGFHCTSGTYVTSETYTPSTGSGGEWHQSDGGWGNDGCDGKFVYVTTQRNPDDPDNWASDLDWRFHLVFGPATCLADIYVPDSPHSGGTARYVVYGSIPNDTPLLGQFTVDQSGQRGHWVAEGPWTTADGQFRVTLTDIGDGRYTVAGAAVRATCTPAPAHR